MTGPILKARRKHAGFATLGVILVCVLSPVARSEENAASRQPLNLPAYVEELERWESAVQSLKTDPAQAAQLRRRLPERWPVAMDKRSLEVSTSWLRAGLNGIVNDPKSSATAAGPLLEHLRAMRRDAQDLAGSSIYPDSTAPRKLDEILSRPEFSGVHGPTWLDRMIERISAWIARQLDRFGSRMSGHPRIVRWMFWLFIIAAGGFLLVWMTLQLLQRSRSQHLALRSFSCVAK